MANQSRRSFLKAVGTAAGSAAVVSGPVSAGGSGGQSQRFLIDLREMSRSEVPDDVTVVHDISQIDLLAASGDPDAVPNSAATMPDVMAFQDGTSYDGGPAKEHTGSGPENKGPAWDGGLTNTELQWDKRVQRVGDLTDKPWNRPTIHDTSTGEGSRVAVVDTGVYDGHPDLADVVNAELSENFTTDDYDFRPNGASDHGTHVAGIVAGTNAGGEGILGTAPDTEIVAHRVFSGVPGEGASTGDTIAALAAAADKGCDAANFSVGYPPASPDESWVPAIVEAYSRLADYARSQGMLIVNSAGNDSVDMTPEDVISLPTEVEGIFGVSATGPIGFLWDDEKSREDLALEKLEDSTTSPAFYTNYGDAVDVSAAGGDADLEASEEGIPGWFYDLVLSTIVEYDADGNPIPGYGWKAGTSMSAPQVTGGVALIRSLEPDAGVGDVESYLKDTASEGEPGGEQYHGAGHLDLRELVKEVGGSGR